MSAEFLQLEGAARPERQGPIDLADELPFQLGVLAVAPALREVTGVQGERQSLEPRVMQVLVALARAEGTIVSRDELIRLCWRGTIVGEDAINRTISLLRRISEGIGRESFRIETIPRVGYRLVLARGDPAKPATSLDATPVSVRALRPKLFWAALAAALAVGVGAFAIWNAAPAGPTYSVSVQPFRISGAGPSFDDELMIALSSRDVPTVGGRIDLALAGSIETSDGLVSVYARLVDAESNEVVWSGAVRRSSTKTGRLAAPAAIVAAITQCTLAGANDAGHGLPLATLARYARSCELGIGGQSAEGIRVARELTREAPGFAAAWFALAHHATALLFRQPREDPELRLEALAAAEKLIELRPDAQEGYVGKALAMDPARPLEREALLRRAADMDAIFIDSAKAYLGDFLLQVGRAEEAFQLHRELQLQQDRDNATNHTRVFLAAAATGRWPIVDEATERVRQLDPVAMPALLWRKGVWAGDWAEAERFIPLAHPAQEQAGIATYRALASGDPARKEAAARLVSALPDDCCVHLRVEMLTLLGHLTEAISLLETFEAARTPGRRPGNVGLFLWDPALRPLWYDPAIEPFLRRNGWIAYWRESGTRPDLCRGGKRPSFCRLLASSDAP